MNTLMYNHPLTAAHLKTIQDIIGYKVVGPIGKNLACGDIGSSLSILAAFPLILTFHRYRSHDRMARHRQLGPGAF